MAPTKNTASKTNQSPKALGGMTSKKSVYKAQVQKSVAPKNWPVPPSAMVPSELVDFDMDGQIESNQPRAVEDDLNILDGTSDFDSCELRDMEPALSVVGGADDTEPFPSFVDRHKPLDPTSLHCMLHCKEPVCRKIQRSYKHGKPECNCSLGEQFPTSNFEVSSAEVDLMKSIHEDEMISIFRPDVDKFIDNVCNDEDYINVRDLAFSSAFRNATKGQHYTNRVKIAADAQDVLIFQLKQHFKVVFSRPLENLTGKLCIAPKQLKLDITALLGIALFEFCDKHFNKGIFSANKWKRSDGWYTPNRFKSLLEQNDCARLVLNAWEEAVDALMRLLMLRYVRYIALVVEYDAEALIKDSSEDNLM